MGDQNSSLLALPLLGDPEVLVMLSAELFCPELAESCDTGVGMSMGPAGRCWWGGTDREDSMDAAAKAARTSSGMSSFHFWVSTARMLMQRLQYAWLMEMAMRSRMP